MKTNQTLVGILVGVVITSAVFLLVSMSTVQTPQIAVQESEAGGLVNPKTFKLPASLLKLSPNKVTVFINGKMIQPTITTSPDGRSTQFNYSGNGVTVSGFGVFTP